MTSYCEYAKGHPVHGPHHDHEHGFPAASDDELFERLMLEINQAGLSWEIILKKRHTMKEAYAGFSIDAVAAFDEDDRERLLSDAGIIRNRLKVNAAIVNARQIQQLQRQFGSFAGWLDAHHPKSKDEWVKLFRKTFKFTGGEIVNEFLMSTGYLPGAHQADCPVHAEVLARSPAWAREENQ
ncbi:MAG: DNA-3-methyladenine glycosylase I [Xanthomonadales bacterium]|nr:DNA-3-methyladenine glycosylase I [Xanthomonadales bacterium]